MHGDSSVYPTLLSKVPVWGYAIKKLECANHAVKCYRSSLENLVKEKPQYKGKGKLTEGMRKKLTKAARCAIKMRSKEENKTTAIKLLQEDLHNGPLHCFGMHSNCRPDYCKVQLASTQIPADTSPAEQESQAEDCIPPSTSSTCSTESTDIVNIIDREITFWNDATCDENTNDDSSARITSAEAVVDQRMIYDIQNITRRLVSKAPYLIGKN